MRSRVTRKGTAAAKTAKRVVEKAIDAAVLDNNIDPFLKLHDILKSPYEEIKEFHEYEKPAKNSLAGYKTFCGT